MNIEETKAAIMALPGGAVIGIGDPDNAYICTADDLKHLASAVGEWVEIRSGADLPKEDGRYFLLVGYIPDGTLSAVGSGFAKTERSPWAFVVSRNAYKPKPIVEALAWMPIPPFKKED